MAIALVGTIGVASQGAAGAAVTPAWGTSETRAAGNLLTCFVAITGSATLPTTPANWSIAKQVAGTSCSATIYYLKAAGSDAAPTIALIASGLIAAQLAEWSGALPVIDQSGSSTGTTSPNTATAGGTNLATAELILMAAADRRSVARASNDTWTSNDGTVTAAGNINGTSSTDHYSFGYIASSSATTAQTSIVTLSITSSITGIANVNVSFPQPAPQTASPSVAALTTTFGTPVLGTGLTPSSRALTLTLSTPTIATTSNVTASPTAASLTATGSTPTVTAPAVSLPGAVALSLSPATPAVTTPVVTLPGSVALTTTGATPAVAAPRVSLPSGASLTAAGATPAIVTPVAVSPAAAAVTSSGATPAVATPIALNPAALALALAYGTPAVVTPSAISPSTASLALTASAPSVAVSGGEAILVTPAALALALAGAVPYVGHHVAGGGIHGFPYIPHAYMVRQAQIEADQRAAATEHLAQQAAEQAEFDRIKAAAAAHLRALHADDELLLLT